MEGGCSINSVGGREGGREVRKGGRGGRERREGGREGGR